MKELGLVVGLLLLVVGLCVLVPVGVTVVTTAAFSALWSWSVLAGAVSAVVGAGVLVRS